MIRIMKAALVASILFGVAVSTYAQDDSAASSGGGFIEEIMVTAQRRAENIQDVPISISAYGGDFIEKAGVQTLSDLALYAPNFTISQSSQQSNARISIRGVGSVGNNAIEPSVGVFIDGIYYPRPGAVIGNLMDIQTVEVLRGPQGTLFGRNTPVGALNISTRNPSDEFEGQITVGFGDFDAYELGLTLSAPFSDRTAGRIAIKFTDRDGFGRNTFDGSDFGDVDNLSVRGKLRFDVSDKFYFTLIADMAELNAGGSTIEVFTPSTQPLFEGTMNALFGATPVTSDSFDHVINQDHRDDLNDEQIGVALDASYEFDNEFTIRSITSFRDWEANVIESAIRVPADILPRVTRYETQTFSQEFQLLSPVGETVEYIAGLFLYDEDYDIDQSFNAGAQFCVPVIAGLVFQQVLAATGDPAIAMAQSQAAAASCLSQQQERLFEAPFDQTLDSIAVFGQAKWNVSDRVSLTLGARYTKDEKKGNFNQLINNTFATLFRVPESSNNLVRDDSQVTWFANASFFPSDETMFFATASSGFKSGGFNSEGAGIVIGVADRIFGPEDSINYELGVKTELFDNAMQANVTLFRTELDDFQDRTFDGLSFFVRNAGELRQQGIEADLTIAPIEQLLITGGFSYLDSEFLTYPEGSPLPGSTVIQNLAGTSKHFSPDWQASTVVEWTDQFGSAGFDWFVRGEWQYVGEQNIGANTNNSPQTLQDGYSLYNAALGLESQDGTWRVSLMGRNLGDEGYCMTMFDQPIGGNLGAVIAANNTSVQRCAVGAPSTYGVTFNYNF